MSANSISRTEYEKGFLAALKMVEEVNKVDLNYLRENRKTLKDRKGSLYYSVSRYGSGVWGKDW